MPVSTCSAIVSELTLCFVDRQRVEIFIPVEFSFAGWQKTPSPSALIAGGVYRSRRPTPEYTRPYRQSVMLLPEISVVVYVCCLHRRAPLALRVLAVALARQERPVGTPGWCSSHLQPTELSDRFRRNPSSRRGKFPGNNVYLALRRK